MKHIYDTLRTAAEVCGFLLIIGGAATASAPVSLPNPILFATQTPFPQDTSTITSLPIRSCPAKDTA